MCVTQNHSAAWIGDVIHPRVRIIEFSLGGPGASGPCQANAVIVRTKVSQSFIAVGKHVGAVVSNSVGALRVRFDSCRALHAMFAQSICTIVADKLRSTCADIESLVITDYSCLSDESWDADAVAAKFFSNGQDFINMNKNRSNLLTSAMQVEKMLPPGALRDSRAAVDLAVLHCRNVWSNANNQVGVVGVLQLLLRLASTPYKLWKEKAGAS